ncbi:MAG: hypothetical protein KF690_00640 [Bacteroidetes bacterium]|nr:hypothetical protein [Bacteroidota bacterium]
MRRYSTYDRLCVRIARLEGPQLVYIYAQHFLRRRPRMLPATSLFLRDMYGLNLAILQLLRQNSGVSYYVTFPQQPDCYYDTSPLRDCYRFLQGIAVLKQGIELLRKLW